MSNKKGFVFIETIVTIVVLAVSLLYVYSGFNNILIKEKTRVNYDDVAYIYRTYYVKNFFARYELNTVLKKLSEDNPMIVIGCDYSDFSTESDADFNEGYSYAENYYRTYGNLNVPYNYKVGAYTLGKFIRNQKTAYSKGLLSNDRKNRLDAIGISWDYSINEYQGIFGDDATGKSICESLVNNLYITRISVALNDLSYVQECDFDSGSISNKCAYLKNFSVEELAYLETIGELDEKNRYIMIVEYTEVEQIKVENSKTGETADVSRDREVHNYAWVRI